MTGNYIYPFLGIVGQNDMKRALILNIINPKIGGALIRGEKGTAKSTAVRALAQVLPLRNEVEGCRFSCDPNDSAHWCEECVERTEKNTKHGRMRVVNLPISATEDRVVGSIDIEHAIKMGEKRFETGIMAEANRNILYVDEVNLLDDHIVDVLLDAAAMGVNIVEREGVSYSHPSNFVLVGTMNPEEGDLRPQLIDRFGLIVDVMGENDADRRVDIMRNRLEFERAPEAFIQKFKEEEKRLGEQIMQAKEALNSISYSDACLQTVAKLMIAIGVDGHRAEITMIKTALTNAAFFGRENVTKEDLFTAAKLALPHRVKRRPFEDKTFDLDMIYGMIENEEI